MAQFIQVCEEIEKTKLKCQPGDVIAYRPPSGGTPSLYKVERSKHLSFLGGLRREGFEDQWELVE